jgi:hypothetical protein
MGLTMLLLVVGGLIGFIAWIWLVIVAFRTGVGWGVVMLLLGWTWIPAIIFAIQHWQVAKRPIILAALALAISTSGYVVAMVSLGSEVQTLLEESGVAVVRNDDAAEAPAEILPPPRPAAEPTHPSWEAVVGEMERPPDGDWEDFVPSPTPDHSGSNALSWDRASTRIGRLVVLELTNSTTVTAVLEAVEPDRLRVRHTIGGGEASYWIERDQIEAIRKP